VDEGTGEGVETRDGGPGPSGEWAYAGEDEVYGGVDDFEGGVVWVLDRFWFSTSTIRTMVSIYTISPLSRLVRIYTRCSLRSSNRQIPFGLLLVITRVYEFVVEFDEMADFVFIHYSVEVIVYFFSWGVER